NGLCFVNVFFFLFNVFCVGVFLVLLYWFFNSGGGPAAPAPDWEGMPSCQPASPPMVGCIGGGG
ncbi:MAG: hypothetical protein ACTHMU_18800, partial [Thermomicrobiales bacterium]